MKGKIKFKRIFGIFLMLTMSALFLVGCKKEKPKPIENFQCEDVCYSPDGNYETYVTGKNLNLVKKDAIEISYEDLDKVNNEVLLTNKQAEIKLVKKVKDKMLVEFRAETITNPKNFNLKVIDGSSAVINVSYPERSLSLESNDINIGSSNNKITFKLLNGEFKGTVLREDLELKDYFKGLTIGEISNTKDTLSLTILDEIPLENLESSFNHGKVVVKKTAILNGFEDVSGVVPIVSKALMVNSKNLAFKEGILTMEVLTTGVLDAQTLVMDDVRFDSPKAMILKLHNQTANSLFIDVAVSEADNLDSALKILNGSNLHLKDETLNLSFLEASFYPVFDYLEMVEDYFEVTLNLLAQNGKFNDLKMINFAFKEEFSGAKVLDKSLVNNETLVLKLKVPKNNQTEADFKRLGEVVLLKGSLINAWNTVTTEDQSYTRDYSQENLGKEMTHAGLLFRVNTTYSGNLKIITKKFACVSLKLSIGTIILGLVEAAQISFDLITSVLKLCGVMESTEVVNQQILNQMNEEIISLLAEQDKLITNIGYSVQMGEFDKFNSNLAMMDNYSLKLMAYFDEFLEKNKISKPTNEASEAEVDEFLNKIRNSGLTEDSDFIYLLSKLESYFTLVCNQTIGNNVRSPFKIYEDVLKQMYNFNTQIYPYLLDYSAFVSNVIMSAYAVLGLANQCSKVPSSNLVYNQSFVEAQKKCEAVMDYNAKMIEHYNNPLKRDLVVDCYAFNTQVRNEVVSGAKEPCAVFSKTYFSFFDINVYKPITAAKNQSNGYKFYERMHGRTFKEELDTAGIYYAEVLMNKDLKPEVYEAGSPLEGCYKFKDPGRFGIFLVFENSDRGYYLASDSNELLHKDIWVYLEEDTPSDSISANWCKHFVNA